MPSSAPHGLEITTPATVRDLLGCLRTIGHFGVAGNLAPDLIARIRVVVEELFTNSIKYGYGEETPGDIRISVTPGPVVTLRYEDDAPFFDPTLWKPSAAAPDGGEGEAGIGLVVGLATTVSYERLPQGNRVTATFAPR